MLKSGGVYTSEICCNHIIVLHIFFYTNQLKKKAQTYLRPKGTFLEMTQKKSLRQQLWVYSNSNYNVFLLHNVFSQQLERNAKVNNNVATIDLATKNEDIPANTNCEVAGWGSTGPEKPSSDVLMETTESIQFSFECKHIWKMYFNSTHMICTKFNKKTGGICQVIKEYIPWMKIWKTKHFIRKEELVPLKT